jgi:sugar phosphate isomerase/epimerase
VELFVKAHELDALGRQEVRRLREQLGFCAGLSLHGPFMDLSPGAVDEAVREVTLRRFRQALGLAASLGARTLVLHSGYEKWRYGKRPEVWLEGSLRTWEAFLPEAQKEGVKVAVENIFEDSPDNLALLMRELGSEAFGVCFDTGHFNLFAPSGSLRQWLQALGPYLLELHLHDNDGTDDAHAPLGEGTFPFGELFSYLAGQPRPPLMTVEGRGAEGVMLSLQRLREYLADCPS